MRNQALARHEPKINKMCQIDCYLEVLCNILRNLKTLSHKEDSVNIVFMYFCYREPNLPKWNEHYMEKMEHASPQI